MWDELFLSRQEDDSFPTYEGGKAFLLELEPANPPPQLGARLFEMRLRGRLPILAHVERYHRIVENTNQLEALAAKAGLLVNLSALGGMGSGSGGVAAISVGSAQ